MKRLASVTLLFALSLAARADDVPVFHCSFASLDNSGQKVLAEEGGDLNLARDGYLRLDVSQNVADISVLEDGSTRITIAEDHCSSERFFAATYPKELGLLPRFSVRVTGPGKAAHGNPLPQNFQLECSRD